MGAVIELYPRQVLEIAGVAVPLEQMGEATTKNTTRAARSDLRLVETAR
jgi:hypothetical protein